MCSRFQVVADDDDDDDNEAGKQLTHIPSAQENAECNAKANKRGMHLRLESPPQWETKLRQVKLKN